MHRMFSGLVGVLLAMSALAARAETILVNSSAGGIYRVEVETGAVSEMTRAPQFFDIAINPDGEIYGITSGSQLWRVDPEGLHVPLSVLGVFVNALEFDRTGTLLGAGADAVVGISIEDGGVDFLGRYPGFASSGDMTFGPSGELYATGSPGPSSEDTLFRLHEDGRTEVIGPTGFRNVYGLVWSAKLGVLLGVTEARELIAIDLETGAGRLLWQLQFPGFGYGAAGFGGDAVISGRPPARS